MPSQNEILLRLADKLESNSVATVFGGKEGREYAAAIRDQLSALDTGRPAFGWPWGPKEPTTKMLREMAYELNLVPRGEIVCVQFLDVLRAQYKAAHMAARFDPSAVALDGERAAFEAALAAGVFDVDRLSDFRDFETEAAWRGWQARAASPQATATQPAQTVQSESFKFAHYDAFTEAHKQVAVEVDALRETLGIVRPAQTVLDETGVIERLSHHIADKRNTAFSRSTMQDAMTLIGELTQTAQTERALTDEQIEDLQEAREILENMVRSVELDGNYSTEATCTFLRQALQCLPAAQPASGGDHD